MKTITVSVSKEYNVIIGSGILDQIGERTKDIIGTASVAVISDSNVWHIYGDTVCQALQSSGFKTVSYVFPAGETSKNCDTYFKILNFLAENKLTRADILIALGGGVVGDITGFCAATYLRGIRYIQVPTSLLAMVDSSVGGKTAIDLPAGKNLAGSVYQPSLVLCDTDLLNTLPIEQFRDGCAEVIKYGVLYDTALFMHLSKNLLSFEREYVISRCIELKRDVVREDEFDTGSRQRLNLGHTIGHAIEKQSRYTISHGRAIATGMAIVSRAAASLGYCNTATAVSICNLINDFGLPIYSDFDTESLFAYIHSDKKRSGSNLNLIVPRSIGNCEILSIPVNQTKTFIEKGSSWILPSTPKN